MNIKGKKINFMGDSITEGVGTSSPDKVYPYLIAQKTGAICRNYGISGTRIAMQTKPSEPPSFDLNFCMRVAEMDSDADIVCIFGGTNDFGHGDAPIGEMSDRTNKTFYGALHTLYSSLIEKYPESKIIIFTPLHREAEDNPYGTQGTIPYGTLNKYVNIIRQVAEYYSLPILDLYATSGLQPNVPIIKAKYVPDGLHPNDAGQEILADKIISYLNNL